MSMVWAESYDPLTLNMWSRRSGKLLCIYFSGYNGNVNETGRNILVTPCNCHEFRARTRFCVQWEEQDVS